MNDLPEKLFLLEPSEHAREIILATAAQIRKDFSEFSFEIQFTGNSGTPYDELFGQLLPVIEKLMANDHSRFYSLLYRIDLSESEIRKASNNNPSVPVAEIITDQIIRRELKKVLYRMFYK